MEAASLGLESTRVAKQPEIVCKQLPLGKVASVKIHALGMEVSPLVGLYTMKLSSHIFKREVAASQKTRNLLCYRLLGCTFVEGVPFVGAIKRIVLGSPM